MPPRLLVTGSRTWTDTAVIRDALRDWWESTGRDPEAILVSGACPKGADRIAERVWEHNGLTVERHPADWKRHGRGAGPTRNNAMVATKPDHLVAFIQDGSSGSSHCLTAAQRAGIPTTVHRATSP